MQVIQKIANEIEEMIQMTFDVTSNYEDKKVPMLDMKTWINEEDKILFEYYEKPTKNRMVITKDSAMPIRNKINILSQEVFRRLHNTSSDIEWDKKVVMLEKFMNELKASGYSKKDRAEILQSGVRRFENLKQKEEKGIRPLYRKRSFDEDERKKRKEEKHCNWFKQTNHEFSTVFFVPPTPDSLLLKNLRKTEQQFKIGEKSRVKFVELSGVKYKEYYRSIDPLSKNCLPDEGCFVCKDMQHDQRDTAPLQYSLGKASTFSENQTHEKSAIAILLSKENRRSTGPPFVKPSFCKTSSVGYSIICKLCKQRNKQVSYEGKTARNAYIRGKEHKREYENKTRITWLKY